MILTNMEHTYIELEFGIHLKDLSEYDCKKVIDIVARLLFDKEKKTRTETLMECRGIVGEEIPVPEKDDEPARISGAVYIAEGMNKEKSRLITAIDNLIKK